MPLPKTSGENCRGNCRDTRSDCRSASVLSPSFVPSLFVLSLFVLLALVGISYAQAAEQRILGVLPAWTPLLAAAFAVGFGLAAVAYMLSAVFRLPELGVWAKSEVGEMVGTAFLVAIVLLAVTVADGVYLAATGSTPMGQSISFTNELVTKSLDVYFDSLDLSTTIGRIGGIPPQYASGGSTSSFAAEMKKGLEQFKASTSASVSGNAIPFLIMTLSAVDVSYQKFAGFSPFMGYFGLIQSSVTSAAAIAVILQMIASFINAVALPVLVPLGVFLSCFALTRKMGRTLIAFGVGLYFFFPASLIISKLMYDSAFKPGKDIPVIGEPSSYFIGEEIGDAYWTKLGLIPLLLPQIVSHVPPPYVGSCPAEALMCGTPVDPITAPLYWSCFIACTVLKIFVIWPLHSFISAYGLYPVASLIVDVPALSEAGVPSDVIAQMALPFVGGYASFKAQYYVELKTAEQLSEIVLNYTPYLLQYSVPVMLMPVIILVVVVTAIRSISPAIGGEVQILGVSELI